MSVSSDFCLVRPLVLGLRSPFVLESHLLQNSPILDPSTWSLITHRSTPTLVRLCKMNAKVSFAGLSFSDLLSPPPQENVVISSQFYSFPLSAIPKRLRPFGSAILF